ncbi:MAG TPA: lipocalin family protein [Ignavibacteria bacterium]|nr:lipocalin family protein [Ignavibacteria bacterium]HMR39635.1 lipocalin family protein [Ignavibacteria bacterium]
MIKYLSIIFLLVFLSGSCGKDNKENENESYQSLSRSVDKNQFESAKFKVKVSPENLTGQWVSSENNSGFGLSDGGIAVSINNPKSEYNSWELIENKLILNSTSGKNKNSEAFKEIYIIRDLYKESMVISPSNNPDERFTYIKK